MATPMLSEGQFSLGGFTFGGIGDAVTISPGGWDRGSTDVQTQDRPRPSGDGIVFGRDRLSPPVWTFSLTVWDDSDSLPTLKTLRSLWNARTVRNQPGATLPLFYREGDEVRVVYGRPRAWAQTPQTRRDRRCHIVTCSFQLAEPVSYSGGERLLRLDLVTTSSTEGARFPLVFPTVFGQATKSREGFAFVSQESAGAPFKLTIEGPVVGSVSGISLEAIPRGDADGIYQTPWTVALPGITVGPGQTLVLDTASGIVTRNGTPVVVGVGARTSLKARLFSGSTEVVYKATDPSATSTATLTWRDVETV